MNEKVATRNHNYCEQTISLKSGLEEGFFVLGERLAKIRDEELYQPSWDSFPEFLEEMKLSEATASKLINIHLQFVVKFGIDKQKLLEMGGWSDLSEILKLADSKEKTIEIIDELGPLLRADRRRALSEKKTGISMGECLHDWTTVHFKQCKKCQERKKVFDN